VPAMPRMAPNARQITPTSFILSSISPYYTVANGSHAKGLISPRPSGQAQERRRESEWDTTKLMDIILALFRD
jgi:hypothetical protein